MILDISRWCAWILVLVAIVWDLRSFDAKLLPSIFLCLLIVLLIVLAEVGLWLFFQQIRKRQEKQLNFHRAFTQKLGGIEKAKAEMDELRIDSAEAWREIGSQLGLVAFLMLLAVILFYPSIGCKTRQCARSDQPQITVQCCSESKNTGPATAGADLRLDPILQNALLGYLQRTGSPSSSTTFSKLGIIVLAGIAIIVLGLVVKHQPKTAPVLGAAGLAEEAIRNADHLSRFSGGWFIGVFSSFLVAGLVLLILGYRQGRAQKAPGSEKANWLLTSGFSVLVLAWIIALVTYHPVQQPDLPLPAKEKFSLKQLPSLQFEISLPSQGMSAEKLKNYRELEGLKNDLKAEAAHGDLLLLIGSADCASYKSHAEKDNEQLAQRRAETVHQSIGRDLDVEPIVLPQYATCAQNPKSRAVFPYLVHHESDNSK